MLPDLFCGILPQLRHFGIHRHRTCLALLLFRVTSQGTPKTGNPLMPAWHCAGFTHNDDQEHKQNARET